MHDDPQDSSSTPAADSVAPPAADNVAPRVEHDVAPRVEHDVAPRVEHDARERLQALDDAPLEEHVAVYEDVHRRLQEGLADLDEA